MAAVKYRDPVMAVTPAKQRIRSGYTALQKQGLLENFDIEVADRTRHFTSSLEVTLTVFLARQDLEIMKIPHELRRMTLGELEAKWGGTWAGTVQRIARLKLEEREREEREEREREEEKERLEREAAAGAGKRKRVTSAAGGEEAPGRTTKNARKGAAAPASTKKGRKGKAAAAASSSKPPSSLPQDHVFNPSLPATPLLPRAPRANESIVSLNGSPLALAPEPDSPLRANASSRLNTPSTLSRSRTTRNLASAADRTYPVSDSENDGGDGFSDEDDEADIDDSFELPDAAAFEAKLLAQGGKQQQQQPASPARAVRKPKRAPSLLFRQSIGGAPATPAKAPQKGKGRGARESTTDPDLVDIELSDGRTISFNPMAVSPGRIQDELDDGGVSKDEQERVQARIKEEAMAALLSSMKKWQVA